MSSKSATEPRQAVTIMMPVRTATIFLISIAGIAVVAASFVVSVSLGSRITRDQIQACENACKSTGVLRYGKKQCFADRIEDGVECTCRNEQLTEVKK